ncbi:Uncharacterised protein [Sebaldella termitidis]|uniref:Uncharacterized protein n=1 Tax=Sebaldella termitidis (strain ATCC 33386 / NCTC 11300) TaxID=526218 RepID=D1AN64_SEBTE|nr:hypothetical protein [Sebaldella termitidis]ACZ09668.1 hypothetical protein Sterm_2824 [Sebaldella termitidis ATCC 33386]SUI25000.1 Uncharacterised protein [Sebaldella termitidis]
MLFINNYIDLIKNKDVTVYEIPFDYKNIDAKTSSIELNILDKIRFKFKLLAIKPKFDLFTNEIPIILNIYDVDKTLISTTNVVTFYNFFENIKYRFTDLENIHMLAIPNNNKNISKEVSLENLKNGIIKLYLMEIKNES